MSATYLDDYITRETDNYCGPYTINVNYISDYSYISGGPLESAETTFVSIDDHNLRFTGN